MISVYKAASWHLNARIIVLQVYLFFIHYSTLFISVLHPMARLTANGSPNGNAVFTCSTSHASCRRVGNTCFHNFSIGLCKPKMWIHYYFNIITETEIKQQNYWVHFPQQPSNFTPIVKLRIFCQHTKSGFWIHLTSFQNWRVLIMQWLTGLEENFPINV